MEPRPRVPLPAAADLIGEERRAGRVPPTNWSSLNAGARAVAPRGWLPAEACCVAAQGCCQWVSARPVGWWERRRRSADGGHFLEIRCEHRAGFQRRADRLVTHLRGGASSGAQP